MDNVNRKVFREISQLIAALKYQATETEALRVTVPVKTINNLHDLWEQLNERVASSVDK